MNYMIMHKLLSLWKVNMERGRGFARKNINLEEVNASFVVSTEFLLLHGISNALFRKLLAVK